MADGNSSSGGSSGNGGGQGGDFAPCTSPQTYSGLQASSGALEACLLQPARVAFWIACIALRCLAERASSAAVPTLACLCQLLRICCTA